MFQPLQENYSMPTTVDSVVNLLYDDISLRDKVIMSKLSEHELDSSVYLAMAKTIRKEFGLYDGNTGLLSSCTYYLGKKYDLYEDPVLVIIKELWKKVKEKHNLRRIK